MTTLLRFWRSLEQMPGLAAVQAEWERRLANEYDAARRFLRPRNQLAESYPHADLWKESCRVVTHGPGDYVAVWDEAGWTQELTAEDLIIYEVDRPLLERRLASALGAAYQPASAGPPTARRLGCLTPLAGFRFPVFLVLAWRGDSFRADVSVLAVRQKQPFLLLAPSRRFLRPDTEELVRLQQGWFLSLSECLAEREGGFELTPAGRRQLEDFRKSALPAEEAAGAKACFATPADAAWEDVRLRFLDGHTLSIRVGAAQAVCNFAQMGMASRKSGSPTVQWELLRTFAEGQGQLTWRSVSADRRNQKRRENLARDLQRFFRLKGDPFVRRGDGWRTRFRVE